MYEVIKAFWGDELVKVPLKIIESYPIPSESKTFLTTVGVPVSSDLLFPFFKNPRDFTIWTHENNEFLVLAEERGQKLCLNVETGEIFIIDSRGELPTRFVNSNIISLVKALQVFEEVKKRSQELGHDDPSDDAKKLRDEFRLIDPKALADVENWWSVILEQMELGLM